MLVHVQRLAGTSVASLVQDSGFWARIGRHCVKRSGSSVLYRSVLFFDDHEKKKKKMDGCGDVSV